MKHLSRSLFVAVTVIVASIACSAQMGDLKLTKKYYPDRGSTLVQFSLPAKTAAFSDASLSFMSGHQGEVPTTKQLPGVFAMTLSFIGRREQRPAGNTLTMESGGSQIGVFDAPPASDTVKDVDPTNVVMVIGVRVDTAFFQKVASLPGPLTLRIGTTEFNVEPEHLKRLSELADALIAK